jgi:hypothetical protein
MKKGIFWICFVFLSTNAAISQNPTKGPVNVLQGGVVDGVVLQDEVPLRSKVEYEYVRPSDYVWSKRVFSRIDRRELINFPLFFPNDEFKIGYDPLSPKYISIAPTNKAQIDYNLNDDWARNGTRYSLWTIIRQHIMNGDLTVYQPASQFFPDVEDGYSFKYPIEKGNFYTDKRFRDQVTPFLGLQGPDKAETYTIVDQLNGNIPDQQLRKDDKYTFKQFSELPGNDELKQNYLDDPVKWDAAWAKTLNGDQVYTSGSTFWIASNSIKAYYVKEDWYFDKERSVLDKRIIAIAPVINYKPNNGQRGLPIIYDEEDVPKTKKDTIINGNQESTFGTYVGQMEERELFWLYFDELRNVLVNYYVYNDKNDAQWMSFDDLFWKRKFSSTIYKVSDKFDREIEDYKFGVEALYESERVKESIRNWEHDLWNY